MGAAEREGPVQGRLYRSLKLWTFYCDLEESLGTPESTRAAYDRIMELRIATPQIVLNYAGFLQVCLNKQWHCVAALQTAPVHVCKSSWCSLVLQGWSCFVRFVFQAACLPKCLQL